MTSGKLSPRLLLTPALLTFILIAIGNVKCESPNLVHDMNAGKRYPSASSVTGGMGLALSNRNRISLGHLTKKDSQNSVRQDSETHTRPPNPSNPYRSMRIMGQPINPNIVSHLHPDVSPRKIHRLWKLLGGKDDKYWTSEEPPRVLRQRGVTGVMSDTSVPPGTNPIDSNLIRKANALNMTFRDQTGAQFLLPESQVQIFRNWLIEQATCEMDFIWKDLGSLYWPRWIRMGVCLARLGSSCSWPPGMKCQPSGSRVLRLLNWNCEDAAQSTGANSARQSSSLDDDDEDGIQSASTVPLSRTARSMRPPVINLRYHLRQSKIPSATSSSVSNDYIRPVRQAAPRTWNYYEAVKRNDRRDVLRQPPPPSQEEKEERRARRARRLIDKLSVTASGYHCSWQVQKYLISDKCTCSCA